MLDRLASKTSSPLSAWQQGILGKYRSGELRQEANKRTRISGHGRVRKDDGTFVDIGGSTGGFVRTVLDDWGPPGLKDFDGDWRFGEDLRRSLGTTGDAP